MTGPRDRFKLQGGGEQWSNKHLPLCEAVGLEDRTGEGSNGECRDVYAALLGRGAGAREASRGRPRREHG